MSHINCNTTKPILNELEVSLTYLNSEKNVSIQAADMIAGTVRRKSLQYYNDSHNLEEYLSFFQTTTFFP